MKISNHDSRLDLSNTTIKKITDVLPSNVYSLTIWRLMFESDFSTLECTINGKDMTISVDDELSAKNRPKKLIEILDTCRDEIVERLEFG